MSKSLSWFILLFGHFWILDPIPHQPSALYMTFFICLLLGFGSFWAGLNLFDDEVILIVSVMVGSVLVLSGLILAPAIVQIPIEVILIVVVFNLCMECIHRGNHPKDP